MDQKDTQDELSVREAVIRSREEVEPAEMSRISNRNKRLSSKKFQRLACLLLLLSLGLLVLRPIYQIATIKKVTSNIKVKAIRHIPNQDQLKQLSNPNEVQLDSSNNGNVIGKLAIPVLELYLPIVKGAGGKNMTRGAATPIMFQRMGTGNYLLTSKQYLFSPKVLFGSLDKLEKGDLIFLTDGESIYEYGVVNLSKENTKDERFLLKEYDAPHLTLYLTGNRGQVVEAELNQIADYATSDSYFKGILNK